MADPPLDLGARIRDARQRRGLTIRDVADALKIRKAWVEAIERNDFDALPGGLFRRAYVRAFAAEVGIDPEPLPEALQTPPQVKSEPDAVVGLNDSWRQRAPTLIAIPILLAVLLLARALWDDRASSVEAPAVSTSPVLPSPVVNTPAGPVASSLPAETPASARGVTGEAPVSLELRFSGPCWVSAVADGGRVVHRLVGAGEHLEIEAQDAIAIEIGNAGAVEASINGGPARVLGAKGEVVRMDLRPPVKRPGDADV